MATEREEMAAGSRRTAWPSYEEVADVRVHRRRKSQTGQDTETLPAHRGGSARPERGRVAACEFGGGNRGTTDQLLEGVGHAVVAVVTMQLAHGDQVCDQMRR